MDKIESLVHSALDNKARLTEDEFINTIMSNCETVGECYMAIDFLVSLDEKYIAYRICRTLEVKIEELPMEYIL